MHISARILLACAGGLPLVALPLPAPAATIGTMTPPEPVSAARIARLGEGDRAAWQDYLARSQARMAADKAALVAERQNHPALSPQPGPSGGGGMPLDKPDDWYGTPSARAVAATIISFQTPAGGWSKNMDRSGPPRRPGESWMVQDPLPQAGGGAGSWSYVGTIDNSATLDEMRFLARVQAAAPGPEGDAARAAFLKGLAYLLDAQYPNGGWPQVYPLQGGYHDAVTFNDDAIAHVLALLDDIVAHKGAYGFVPDAWVARARAAFDRAIAMILAAQVRVNGVPTAWSQQHDALTLAPCGARNFEPAALASNESARLLMVLMRESNPSPGVVAAVHAGIAWLGRVALTDRAWQAAPDPAGGKALVNQPGAPPLWARFYDMATMRPVFGDRDRTIHDDVRDLPPERQRGYSWYGTGPGKAIKAYATWVVHHPR